MIPEHCVIADISSKLNVTLMVSQHRMSCFKQPFYHLLFKNIGTYQASMGYLFLRMLYFQKEKKGFWSCHATLESKAFFV